MVIQAILVVSQNRNELNPQVGNNLYRVWAPVTSNCRAGSRSRALERQYQAGWVRHAVKKGSQEPVLGRWLGWEVRKALCNARQRGQLDSPGGFRFRACCGAPTNTVADGGG